MIVKVHNLNTKWLKGKIELYLKDKYGILTTSKLSGMTIVDALLMYYIPESFFADLLSTVKQCGIYEAYHIVDRFLYNTIQAQLITSTNNFDDTYPN